MIRLAVGLFVSALLISPAGASCVRTPAGSFGVPVWRSGSAIGFATKTLEVDADGAPDSYRIDGNGLSYTCDGVLARVNGVDVEPGQKDWQTLCQQHWTQANATQDYSQVHIFGFEANCPGPCIQQAGDALPNEAYISTTTMSVPNTNEHTTRHYVNARDIPYIVLRSDFLRRFNVAPGDVAAVYRPKTGAVAFAIYADEGNLGEGSVRLHQDLGNQPISRFNGVARAKNDIPDQVVTIVFPAHRPTPGTDNAAWYKQIQDVGAATLAAWGGPEMLKACAEPG